MSLFELLMVDIFLTLSIISTGVAIIICDNKRIEFECDIASSCDKWLNMNSDVEDWDL